MAHVGEELGLVAAGALEVIGALLQRGLRLRQLVLLVLEQGGLGRELRVGLLQLGLLHFHLRLRGLERTLLLFELFVADAQLFLLGLQLLGLALGFFQQLFELRAVARGAHGDGQLLGGFGQQPALWLGDRLQEAELDHRLHPAIDHRGGDQQLARRGVAEAGAHPQVALGHVGEVHQALVLRGLAEQPVAGLQRLGALAGVDGIGSHALQPAVGLDGVDGADLRAEIAGEEAQHVVAQHVEPLVALQRAGERRLARAQPQLAFSQQVLTRGPIGGIHDERQQHDRCRPGDDVGVFDSRLPALLLRGEVVALLLLDVVDHGADAVHRRTPAVGAHGCDRGFAVTVAGGDDGLLHLGQLVGDQAFQCVGALQLGGVALHQLAQRLQPCRHGRLAFGVGREVALLAGEQEATLAGLGVFHAAQHRLQLLDDLVGAGDAFGGLAARFHHLLPDDGDEHDRQRLHDVEQQRARRQRQLEPRPPPGWRRRWVAGGWARHRGRAHECLVLLWLGGVERPGGDDATASVNVPV